MSAGGALRTSRPRRWPITVRFLERPLQRSAAMLRMADRDREGIGGVRAESALQGEQRLDHVHDLGLLGGAGAGDGLLDGARRVLEYRRARHGRRRKARRPRACPSFRALSGFRCMKTRSIAISPGV